MFVYTLYRYFLTKWYYFPIKRCRSMNRALSVVFAATIWIFNSFFGGCQPPPPDDNPGPDGYQLVRGDPIVSEYPSYFATPGEDRLIFVAGTRPSAGHT